MAKWTVTLSTTEPYNYVGIINVRQGNRNSETMEVTVSQNGMPVDLSQCKAYLEAILSNGFAIQRVVKIIDAKNGKIQYTFDEYSMQALHRQTANFVFYQGEDVVATTQDFSYFVIKAVSKTEGEMGSYWQTVEDLIADMANFINENQGDFTQWMAARKKEFDAWRQNQQDTFEQWRNGQESDYLTWFESIKEILKSVDPGGVMLSELMDARVDIDGNRHASIAERLQSDAAILYQKLRNTLFLLPHSFVESIEILQDDQFSKNHEVKFIEDIDSTISEGALMIATIDDKQQNVYTLSEVGNLND